MVKIIIGFGFIFNSSDCFYFMLCLFQNVSQLFNLELKLPLLISYLYSKIFFNSTSGWQDLLKQVLDLD